MVSPVTYRAPSLLVKQVTTLDVISNGRAWFGIGAG
jgi:alkanesulfonate monooxygenase SsuD/methylene tetrahydromethanopterin reductase-like flavin-dependent oxidoreductase (luciferase family)